MEYLNKLSTQFNERKTLVLYMIIGFVLLLYQYKFGIGKTINTVLFMTAASFIVYSFNRGITMLMISFSIFSLDVFFSVITCGITVYYQISFLALVILALVAYRDRKQLKTIPKFDMWLTLFYVFDLLVFAVIGVIKGGPIVQVIKEVFLFGLWVIPLLIPYFFNRKSVKYILYTIVFITFFISFIYIRADFLKIYNFQDNRVYSRHVFMYVFILPYVFTWFLLSKKYKIFYFIAFSVSIWGLLITQTRSVLLGIFLSFVVSFFLVKGVSLKKILITLVSLITLYILFINYFPNEFIRERIASFSEFYKDNSFLMRFVTSYDIFTQYGSDLFKGLGLANLFSLNTNPLYKGTQAHWVDIGYISIIAKCSILGLGFILTILGRVWYNSFKQFRVGVYQNIYHQIAVIGTMCTIPSVLLINFLFPIMIKYIYLIILVMVISLPQYYKIQEQRKKYKEEKYPNDIKI